jgi:hypothetical protein
MMKKWIFRLAVTALVLLGFLFVIVLNPLLTYAHKTSHLQFTVYHQQPLESRMMERLENAHRFLKKSELYEHPLKLDICLNDGSRYPDLIRAIRGPAFAWGFYDKVVLQGALNCAENYVELNGYKWNLTQLLAHEMTHCLQYERLGLMHSKPIRNIANWKWEGYAEYVSRQGLAQNKLKDRLQQFYESDTAAWAITFEDGTISSREYFRYWNMVEYCLEIKQMSYQKLLADASGEEVIETEMREWYQRTMASTKVVLH